MRSPLGMSLMILLCALLLAACALSPAAAPTLQPAAPATAAPTLPAQPAEPTAASDPASPEPTTQAGDRAPASVLRVATSLDNPPFSYSDDQGRPAGFDMALITELARRLGLTVEIKDMPFESLPTALGIDRADVAIAAISITPDRTALMDFTNAYYVGEDGVLAAPDSSVRAVSSLDDLAKLKVGVQKSTIYESWVRENAVDTGKMPASNIAAYDSPEAGAQALAAGEIDVVLLDRQPALTFVQQGKARLVGAGLYPQVYGIATQKGSSLRSELNQVLAEAQGDGTVARLVDKHLRMPATAVLPATRRPAATSTP